MDEQAIAIYVICDELTRFLGITDDPQALMTEAEVMTFALLAATQFQGDYRKARLICLFHRYFPRMLSHSRVIRRIHRIDESVWHLVFIALRTCLRKNQETQFIIDSFPVKAYENHKSFRARIFNGKKYHGYTASKKQYFFGLKVHMIVDLDGVPIEVCLTPASISDIAGLRSLPTDLPEESVLFADKAYLDYALEDVLRDVAKIELLAARKKNLKRQHTASRNYILKCKRNLVETVFSSIASRMPRYIRARTEKGFCLKVFFFVLAYMINLGFPLH